MKRKRRGSIFMAAVLSAVSLAATPIVAHADHTIPGTEKNPKLCNNTYVDISHIGLGASYEMPAHYLSNGQSCSPTRYVYAHRSRCSSCGAIIQDWWYFYCEERHSLCGTVIMGLGH